MGGTSWSDEHYAAASSAKLAMGYVDSFVHDADVKSGKVSFGVHESLDPKKIKNGKRECRDSAVHPESKPIYIGLDVTGSMRDVPKIIQSKLPQVMGLIQRGGYVDHPAICMSAIGDADYDRIPFQVGQFESGIEIDNDISNLYLEGGGGGNNFESYELALYFLAYMVDADEWEKRDGKGYAFIICDESLTNKISKDRVEMVFGIKLQADLDTAEVVGLVKEKWNLFCIVPNMTAHYRNESMKKFWKDQLGQNLIMLEDPNGICETITSLIAASEGIDMDTIHSNMVSTGTSSIVADNVSRAISKVAGGAISTKGSGLATL